MKKNFRIILLRLSTVTCLLLLQLGCIKDHATKTYTLMTPVYKAKAEVLAEINGSASQPVENAGKIYIKDQYIFLNEIDKGIHIIDNSNPANPVPVAFLKIPGNQDIAVKGNTLYADMYDNLLAIDISNVKHVSITAILHGFFIERGWVNGADTSVIVTDWIKKDTTVPAESTFQPVIFYNQCDRCVFAVNNAALAPATKGVAGSMAKMVLLDNHLYAIKERHSLGIVNVNNAAAPYEAGSINAGYDLETIYPFKDKLFLGSAVGLFMFDVSDPEHPAQLGQFEHGRACDPVVADGDYAYVTLHSGTECGGDANELNVINIQNLMNPTLQKSYPLTKPSGLSKDGNLLFICDGTSGVRLYDATNVSNLQLIKKIESNEPYDVIAGNNHALVVQKDGLYQYDYTNVNNIKLLSVIGLKHK